MAAQKRVNYSHNASVLSSLVEGDLVQFKRGSLGYSHWAVFIGGEEVIHLWAEDDDGVTNVNARHVMTVSGHRFDKAKVRRDNFWKVVEDDIAYKNNDKDGKWKPLPRGDIVRNAFEKLGKVGYSILYENCEHFAKWCRYGISKSDQADNVLTGLAVGAAGALVVGLVHAAATYFGGDKEKKKERHVEL